MTTQKVMVKKKKEFLSLDNTKSDGEKKTEFLSLDNTKSDGEKKLNFF